MAAWIRTSADNVGPVGKSVAAGLGASGWSCAGVLVVSMPAGSSSSSESYIPNQLVPWLGLVLMVGGTRAGSRGTAFCCVAVGGTASGFIFEVGLLVSVDDDDSGLCWVERCALCCWEELA
jgi:hypothetical protein